MDGMVDDQAVFVVADLGLAAELDRLAEAALGDWAGVGFVKRHESCRA